MDARQSSRLTRLLLPGDPDAPCPQWQAMARLAGAGGEGEWRCEQTGEEVIDGNNALVFHVFPGSGHAYVAWIDRARKFPLRIRTEDEVLITLEVIKDEPWPATSFELPGNLRKFSPEALVERIKQSDVWVSAPQEARPPRP